MLDKTKTHTHATITGTGTYKDLQALSEKHCDGEISHDEYRGQLIELIRKLPDAELTKLAEATMGMDELLGGLDH